MKMAELLQELGWSQGYFAARVGISPGTVSGWRKSGRCPSLALAYLEAEVLLKRIMALAAPSVVRPRGKARGVPIHLQGEVERPPYRSHDCIIGGPDDVFVEDEPSLASND